MTGDNYLALVDRLLGYLFQGGVGWRPLRGGEMRARQMRQRRQTEVAIDGVAAGRRLAQALDDRGRNLAADGVGAENAGVDMQKSHGNHPWYWFVTETI